MNGERREEDWQRAKWMNKKTNKCAAKEKRKIAWNRKQLESGDNQTIDPVLFCLTCLSGIWHHSLNSSPGPGHPQIPAMICGGALLSLCWADLRRVLSSSSLRHQPGHYHDTSHACTVSKEAHSSGPCDKLWFYQWSDPFLWDHQIIKYGKTKWRQADRHRLVLYSVCHALSGRWWIKL